jgi:phosphoglycolate phosphatase
MADLVLIFDLDGTLIDSAPDIHANVNLIMAENGIPGFTPAEVRSFIGGGVDILIARCLGARALPVYGVQHRAMTGRFIALYETSHSLTSLYPHVAEVLAALPHGLAICTNKPEVPTRAVLEHLNLARFFPVVVGGDTLPQKKPDPAPLHEAIARMGDHPALFIGDSEVDAATARAAGVPFLLFTEGYRKTPADQLGAAGMFSDWQDLSALVRTHSALA